MITGTRTKCGECNQMVPLKDIGGTKDIDGIKHQICQSCLNRIEYGIDSTKELVRIDPPKKLTPLENLPVLRNLLFDTMTIEDQTSEQMSIQAAQKMNVELSPSAIKHGTQNFYQVQSVVGRQVTNNLVHAVKVVLEIEDDLRRNEVIDHEEVPLVEDVSDKTLIEDAKFEEVSEINLDTVLKVIGWISTKSLTLKEYEYLMKGLLCQHLVLEKGSSKKVSELLRCCESNVSLLVRRLKNTNLVEKLK